MTKRSTTLVSHRVRVRIRAVWRQKWVRIVAAVCAVVGAAILATIGYYYASFARVIDARLHGERDRVLPRVYARPLELRKGQALTAAQLIDRLNDLGFAQRAQAEKPGEFATDTGAVVLIPRGAEFKAQPIRAVFERPDPPGRTRRRTPAKPAPADRILDLSLGKSPTDRLTLDAPLLTSLVSGEREKRRPVALAAIPPHMIQAVLAVEDHRFYDHPGVDIIGTLSAVVTNLRGNRPYLVGGSTITQQLVKNFFLTPEKSIKRKLLEQFMALVLERRATKDEILELYLNDIFLGQRGSFAVRGVPEAARLFFAKDISNLSIAEAATIAGVIQSPSALSPFSNPERSRERRNVVLGLMAEHGFVAKEAAQRAAQEPLTVVQRALEAEAPYFVDYVGQRLEEDYPGLTTTTDQGVGVHTTLDLHLQRLAQDAVRDGLTRVDNLLARRKRKGRAEAVLLAVDPKTGDVLAMVGGRSYNQSQLNRAVAARRQPGSVFKPFVYLTAFEEAMTAGRTDVTPASIVDDSPTTWEYDDQVWTPENYEKEYDGLITFRSALAHSRNIATVKVAEEAGYENIVNLWKKLGVNAAPKPYPSIALGVFEATPFEIATAYTLFPNMGVVRPLKTIASVSRGSEDVTKPDKTTQRAVSRPETTFLVVDMLRSVINAGTAAGARGAGFTLDAGGKTGTTNDLRDAWFAGFTPELLTIVWVGFDDNQPVGLSGSQAALPIWTQFMKGALAGHPSVPFEAPDGISYVDIDPETGKLAAPGCPKVTREPFVAGTEPVQVCDIHRF